MQLKLWLSVAFGDVQIALMRELAARLKAGGTLAAQTLPLQASTDQLEAAVREARRLQQNGGNPAGQP